MGRDGGACRTVGQFGGSVDRASGSTGWAGGSVVAGACGSIGWVGIEYGWKCQHVLKDKGCEIIIFLCGKLQKWPQILPLSAPVPFSTPSPADAGLGYVTSLANGTTVKV